MNSLVPQWVDDALRCPRTKAPLQWQQREEGSVELITVSDSGPRYAYPVVGGVPILLDSEARELAPRR